MKTVYITAGHGGNDPGAVSQFGKEAEEARKFVTSVAKSLYKKGVFTYTDDNKWSLSQVISWLGTKIKSSDYTIDIHFNAGPATATGVEVLIPEKWNTKEFEMAKGIASIISKTLNLRLRSGKVGNGVKTESESQHSRIGILSNNRLSAANNVLVEICFISNKTDMESYKNNYDLLIENVSNYIAKNI